MKSVLASVALLAAAPVAAAPPAAPATIVNALDPAAVAAAERMMDAMNYDKLMDQTLEAMTAQMKQSIPAQIDQIAEHSGTKLPEDFKQQLMAVVTDSMGRVMGWNKAKFRQETALIYARNFSAAEIDRMTEIQKDPVIQKMQTRLPAIMAESFAMTQSIMAEEMPRMLDDVKKLVADFIAQQGKTDAS